MRKKLLFISACLFIIISHTASAETLLFTPSDDSYAQKNKPDELHGDSSNLILRYIGSNFSRLPFLKFQVTGVTGNISSVKLKLYSLDQAGTVWTKEVADSNWTEEIITWNNMPAMGAIIDTITFEPNIWNEFDLTEYVTGDGTYSIGLETPVDTVGKIRSKESSNIPVLEIIIGQIPNMPPEFNTDPIDGLDATEDEAYTGSLADEANDPNGDPLTFLKISGPAWLAIASDGGLSGIPANADVGYNSFIVQVADNRDANDQATLNIKVTGSANINGIEGVDFDDFNIMAYHWLSSCTDPFWCDGADLDVNGIVNWWDFEIFSKRWLEPAPDKLTVANRAGADVTDQLLVDSDHIHLALNDALAANRHSNIASYTYKLAVQAAEPTSGQWNSISASAFYRDLYFFREPTNQWIRIIVDYAGTTETLDVIYGLQGGILTAPPDDPMLPVDYVDRMGPGLIVEGKPDRTVYPETDALEIKKAGFNHVRMHVNRDPLVPGDPGYYDNLDRWITQTLRHGMHCHIGNSGRPTPGIIDDESAAYRAAYHADMLNWWTQVADHCKLYSHRLAYHMFLETGGESFLKDAAHLNPLYEEVTEAVRLIDSARLLIYTPPKLNSVYELPNMTFPYPDMNPGDGIQTGSGPYFFSDFHKGFAGGADWDSQEGKDKIDVYINAAIDWIADNNIPLILSACRPTNSNGMHNEYIAQRKLYVDHIYSLLDLAKYPIRVTWLTHDNYYDEGIDWFAGKLVLLEAMNRQATVDANDPDGDLVSTYDELNIYFTDPNSPDSDQDNILDTYEVEFAELNPTDPLDGDPENDHSIDADFDGDGIGNAMEMLHYYDWGKAGDGKTPFDFRDATDADLNYDSDLLSNIWDCVAGFTPHNDKSANKKPDDFTDHDKDDVNTIDEIYACTWPRDKTDTDFDGSDGSNDPIPYVHDLGHIVRYTFDDIIGSTVPDTSSQGADNTGSLIGDVNALANILFTDGNNSFVDIPTTDLGTTGARSIHLYFNPQGFASGAEPYQVLYKEGDAAGGLAIYLNEDKIWIGAWTEIASVLHEHYIDLHATSLQIGQWYAVTLVFDGDANTLSGWLYEDNARLSKISAPIDFGQITITAGRTTLAGSDDNSRFWDESGGASVAAFDKYFIGYLDDTQIYNRPLSEVDIARLSREDLPPCKNIPVPPQ